MNEIPAELKDVLSSDPEVVGGSICFTGTRVPVRIFLDCIATGISLSEFEQSYPRVGRESELRVLEWLTSLGREAFHLEAA